MLNMPEPTVKAYFSDKGMVLSSSPSFSHFFPRFFSRAPIRLCMYTINRGATEKRRNITWQTSSKPRGPNAHIEAAFPVLSHLLEEEP